MLVRLVRETGVPERPTPDRRGPRPKSGRRGKREDGSETGSAKGRPGRVRDAQLSVGGFVRATREAAGLTQAEVAERTREGRWQLSRAAVSAIERGQNFPGLEAMLALSSVLHIDPKEILERARLTAVAPVDASNGSFDELETRAGKLFWDGDFNRALAVYDALVHRLALESRESFPERTVRWAMIEVRRATALKRSGALLSAIGAAERAIALAADDREVQAEAYHTLATLQAQRGHLPLADDAAQRAIELASGASETARARAWMVKGHVLFLRGGFEAARQAFLEARSIAEGHDAQHLGHIDGNIAQCWARLGDDAEAERWLRQALETARTRNQPAIEASWLVELGKLELGRERLDEADALAVQAIALAGPRDHRLTLFRAEWLRHLIARRHAPGASDEQRLTHLDELYRQLDEHEGVDEIRDFRRARGRLARGARTRDEA